MFIYLFKYSYLLIGRFSEKGAQGNLSVADGTNWNRYAPDQRAQPYPTSQTSGLNTGRTNPVNNDEGEYSVPKKFRAAAAAKRDTNQGTAAGEQDDEYSNSIILQNSMVKSTSKSKPLPSLPPNECAGASAVEAGGARVTTKIVTWRASTGANAGPGANNEGGEGAVVNAVVIQVPPLPAKPSKEQEGDYVNFQKPDAVAAKKSQGISRKSSFKKLMQKFQS